MADQSSQGKVQDIKDKAQDGAASAADKAKQLASDAAQRASDVASKVHDKADDALAAVGERLSNLAGRIKDNAPQGGTLGTAAGVVADKMQAGGDYLSGHDLQGIGQDLGGLIRNYPIQSLLVGLGVGYLMGMMSKR